MAETTEHASFEDEEAIDFLSELHARVLKVSDGNDRAFMGLLGAVVFQDVMGHFSAQAGPSGPWADWSEFYAEHMAKIGKSGNNLLQDNGRLRTAMAPVDWRVESAGFIWFNAARTRAGFPYAYAHDTGGPKLPQREFMWLSADALDKIEAITLEHLLK